MIPDLIPDLNVDLIPDLKLDLNPDLIPDLTPDPASKLLPTNFTDDFHSRFKIGCGPKPDP